MNGLLRIHFSARVAAAEPVFLVSDLSISVNMLIPLTAEMVYYQNMDSQGGKSEDSRFKSNPKTEAETLGLAIEYMREALEILGGFEIELERENSMDNSNFPKMESARRIQRYLDAIITLNFGGEKRVRFAVEIKNSPDIRNLGQTLSQLNSITEFAASRLEPMIVARYLPSSSRKWLKENKVSYADATGNFMLRSYPEKLLLLSDEGASRDPWRGPGRPRNSFSGVPAAKIFRILVDHKPPYSVPEIIKLANASTGVAYRVVEFLERENIIQLDKSTINNRSSQIISSVNWKKLLEDWSQEYAFQASNAVTNYLDPKGINSVMEKLKSIPTDEYAITGSVAASRWHSYAPSKQLSIFAKYPRVLAKELGLREVDTGANIQIASSPDESIFECATVFKGISYASISQVAIDLLGGSGRNPSEGEELISWMTRFENEWRKS